jgi:N-acetylmuramoyl-L-alanine amidase
MKKTISTGVIAAMVLLFSSLTAFSAITVRQLPSGRTGFVASIERDGMLEVALPLFLEQLGFIWQWDETAGRLTCVRNETRFIFTEDVPFYTFGLSQYRLSVSPKRIGATLFVPASEIVEIGKCLNVHGFEWDSVSRTITIDKPLKHSTHTIVSVSSEKKQNGVLVTIDLADSVPFDYTYYYPNVTLSFFGATVDTAAVRSLQRLSILDSVFSIQYKESAQVSLIVSREIEDPQIDYLQDMHTVLVSLRSKRPVKEKPAPEAVNEAVKAGIRTVVIDPGHGGIDPGALGQSGTKEKDVALDIAMKVRDILEKKPGIKVYCTRENDVFVPLCERTRMANKLKADLFISIHANAVPGDQKKKDAARGYKVYFLSQAKNEEDKLVAMRENAVIELEEKPQNYTALQNVLSDLAGNEFLRESQDICILLDRQFQTQLHEKINRLALGIGQANFWVLNGAYMPSILIETGFISNLQEERLLTNISFQVEMASAIANAVISFKKKYEN